jgi:hypothetical protein
MHADMQVNRSLAKADWELVGKLDDLLHRDDFIVAPASDLRQSKR